MYDKSQLMRGTLEGCILKILSQNTSYGYEIVTTLLGYGFKDIKEISMNPYLDYTKPNFWLSCLLLSKDSQVTPDDIRLKLSDLNIESRPIWNPMHKQPVFQNYDYIKLEESVSEDIFNRGLCLPSDIKNTSDDMKLIINTIKEMF